MLCQGCAQNGLLKWVHLPWSGCSHLRSVLALRSDSLAVQLHGWVVVLERKHPSSGPSKVGCCLLPHSAEQWERWQPHGLVLLKLGCCDFLLLRWVQGEATQFMQQLGFRRFLGSVQQWDKMQRGSFRLQTLSYSSPLPPAAAQQQCNVQCDCIVRSVLYQLCCQILACGIKGACMKGLALSEWLSSERKEIFPETLILIKIRFCALSK